MYDAGPDGKIPLRHQPACAVPQGDGEQVQPCSHRRRYEQNPIATARSTNAALKLDGAALFMAVAACSCDVESDMRALRNRRGGSEVDST
jgi:hypothetical protein